MLQWMGGSRRKVTTSRKSTQKKQKQYFEQRKRQQQQAPGLDSNGDHKEHRSLDVLSLLNLSTAAEEHKCVCPNGIEDTNINASTMKYPITKYPPKIFANTTTFADFVEYKEAGTPSGYQAETTSLMNVSYTAPDNENNAFDGSSYKPDLLCSTTDQQLSVFDLLADDGPSGNLEGCPVHEAHVAFSIEGLGRVGTQTPIHSPKQTGWAFQYGCSSPWKAARRPNSSKKMGHVLDDFELGPDSMMQDMNMPPGGSYLEFSSGTINSPSNRKHKYSPVNDCAILDGYDSKLESSFDDFEVFYATGNNNEDLWDARSSFLDDNFLNEKEFNADRRNWPDQMEGIDILDYEISDYALESPHLRKDRVSVKAAYRYKYPRYPEGGMNFDFREPISQWNRSCCEDARDNLSLLSEESCSSTAVTAEVTNKSPPNSTARKSRRPKDSFGSDGNRCGLRNMYTKETRHQNRFDIQQGSYACGSGKCTKMPSPSKSKSKHFANSNSSLQEKFGPRVLFGEGYTSADMIPDFSSFSQTSEMEVPSLGSKPQMLDPFCGFPVPLSNMGAKSSFDGSKHSKSVQYSSLGGTACEKFPFCKPLSHMSCHDSPIFQNLEFVTTKPSFSLDLEPLASFSVAQSRTETIFPDLPLQESVDKDEESKSEAQPANCKKVEPGKQNSSCSNCLLSKIKETIHASDSEDSIIECKEAKDGTSEQRGSPKTPSPEHVVEASPMKNPDKFEHVDDKNQNARIPFSSENEVEGIDDAGPESKILSQTQGNSVDTSSPVVMLESYVLQLLCVQKVVKDSSEADTMKEV